MLFQKNYQAQELEDEEDNDSAPDGKRQLQLTSTQYQQKQKKKPVQTLGMVLRLITMMLKPLMVLHQ